MSLAFIDPEKNAFEFHDLDKDMSNIPDGSTEKSNHEIHQNFVIFRLSIVENNRVTHFRKNFSHHKNVHSKDRFLQKLFLNFIRGTYFLLNPIPPLHKSVVLDFFLTRKKDLYNCNILENIKINF